MVGPLISTVAVQASKVVKRKTTTSNTQSSKRARAAVTPTHNIKLDSSSISTGSSQDSSISAKSSQDGLSLHGSLTSTKQTPLPSASSRPSSSHPSELKSYHCSYQDCLKSFDRPARLIEHLRSHTNERPFVCPHPPCTKDFLRATHLNHHVKSAHTDVREYVCEWQGCGKSFLTGTRLKRHLAAHEDRMKYKCDIAGCEQTFRKHSTLQNHTAVEHEGRMPFICQHLEYGKLCETGFDTAGKLKKHKERMHGGDKFWCTICGAEDLTIGERGPKYQGIAFSTYAAFQSHNRNFHSPTCTECGLECGSSKELTRHLEIYHGMQPLAERKTHTCTEQDCGRSFTSKANLKTHIRVGHIGERRFICGEFNLTSSKKVSGWDGKDSCGKRYTSKANLEEHVRTAHMGLEYTRKAREKKSGRKANTKAKSRSIKKKPSVISRLVGSAYDEDSTRHIPCLHAGCDLRFTRDYDLEVHLQRAHGLAPVELEHQRAEGEGAGPSMYGYELFTGRTTANREAKMALEMQSEILNAEDEGMQIDMLGDVFETQLWGGFFAGDEWEKDEKKMRELIEAEFYLGEKCFDEDKDGEGGPDGAQTIVDPLLE